MSVISSIPSTGSVIEYLPRSGIHFVNVQGTPPQMIYLDIFRGLQEEGVRYLVVGGLAMNLHGIPRMTADVDLYVDLEKANANRFLAAVKALGFVPGIPVPAESFADPEARDTWRREKNMLVMGFVNPSRPAIGVDVFVFEPVPFGPAYERRKRVSVEGEALEIPVASREDLIAMKEGTGRLQDASDVKILRRGPGEGA